MAGPDAPIVTPRAKGSRFALQPTMSPATSCSTEGHYSKGSEGALGITTQAVAIPEAAENIGSDNADCPAGNG
jgi:hypothetical protein